MVALPSSRMTGTRREPFECSSISVSWAADFLTFRYSTSYPFAANASRASEV